MEKFTAVEFMNDKARWWSSELMKGGLYFAGFGLLCIGIGMAIHKSELFIFQGEPGQVESTVGKIYNMAMQNFS